MLQKIRDDIVIPALAEIGAYSHAAEQLVMLTGMGESLFKSTRQIARYQDGKPVYGPARSWFQMEPATHDDIWAHYLGATSRAHLVEGLRRLSDRPGDIDELEHNQKYAAAMCRIFYLRVPKALPAAGDWRGMAEYWKRYYNTPGGKGTVEGFLQKVAPVIEMYETEGR